MKAQARITQEHGHLKVQVPTAQAVNSVYGISFGISHDKIAPDVLAKLTAIQPTQESLFDATLRAANPAKYAFMKQLTGHNTKSYFPVDIILGLEGRIKIVAGDAAQRFTVPSELWAALKAAAAQNN